VFLKHELKHKASREGEDGALCEVFRAVTVSVTFMFTNVLKASGENHHFTEKDTYVEENHHFTKKDTYVNCTVIFLSLC
jgi:hypothetical protein